MNDIPLPFRLAASPILAVLLAATFPACGKKGPPLPPIRHAPEPVQELGIRQIGQRLLLTMIPPRLRTDATELRAGTELEISMTAREQGPADPSRIVRDPDVVWGIPSSDWGAYARGDRLRVSLKIGSLARALKAPPGGESLVGRHLSFVVRVLEPKRRASTLSSIRTQVICEPPAPPVAGQTRLVEQGVEVIWSARAEPDPAGGYNVYRREPGGDWPGDPMNEEPLGPGAFLDETARPGVAYEYGVRSGRLGCESDTGALAAATWTDIFAPSVPEGLAAVTEEGAIRLFWRPNREPDLHGYRVYRSEGSDSEMRLLAPEDVTATTYTDTDVTAGIVYIYAVTARDNASPPNESPRSEEAVESMEQ